MKYLSARTAGKITQTLSDNLDYPKFRLLRLHRPQCSRYEPTVKPYNRNSSQPFLPEEEAAAMNARAIAEGNTGGGTNATAEPAGGPISVTAASSDQTRRRTGGYPRAS